MDPVRFKLLSREAYGALSQDERHRLPPGSAYEMWWWHDPHDPDGRMTQFEDGGYLSEYYWRDWANTRPPITVICPDGNEWCIDQRSHNGKGWVVTGVLPMITCSPSIDFSPAYHGFLQNGIFTPDLNGERYRRGAVWVPPKQ